MVTVLIILQFSSHILQFKYLFAFHPRFNDLFIFYTTNCSGITESSFSFLTHCFKLPCLCFISRLYYTPLRQNSLTCFFTFVILKQYGRYISHYIYRHIFQLSFKILLEFFFSILISIWHLELQEFINVPFSHLCDNMPMIVICLCLHMSSLLGYILLRETFFIHINVTQKLNKL